MLPRTVIVAVFMALISHTNAVPLNINLGAYSPALVVGDGEISLGAEKEVAGIMTALSGAAANADANTIVGNTAAAAAATTAEGATQAQVATPETQVGTAAPAASASAAPALTGQGLGKEKEIDPRSPVPEPAPAPAPEADSVIPSINILTKSLVERAVASGQSDIAVKLARDLQGFQAALTFAENAIKTTPEIQLGTGAKGSGVGILQAPGVNAGTATAAAAARRDVSSVEKRVIQGPEVDSVNLNIGASNGVRMSITEIQN